MPTLLVIDDDPAILRLFDCIFQDGEVTLLTASSARAGVERFSRQRPDAVVLDIDLPDQYGLQTFLQLQQLDPQVPIVFITGCGTTATAIEAMALGAYEYVLKPFSPEKLRELMARAFEVSRLMRLPAVAAEAEARPEEGDVLIGRNPGMQDVYKAIGRVARRDVTVLVLGESGTGKELVARAIYRYSLRCGGPFLAINSAAIPEPLLESELFGHEQGAFTGADRRRLGKFEQCSGGTLFLDEVGDMSPTAQTKVLRVLQDQQFERVGGNATVQTDVRLIAATNRDLPQLVATGQFRKDLYYRLNGYTIRLPALRERLDDLPLLVDFFLQRFRRELSKDVRGAVPESLELLRQYPWPGNIRELQSVLKHAILQATGPCLLPEFFHPSFRTAAEGRRPLLPAPAEPSDLERFVQEHLRAGSQDLYADWLGRAERRLFRQVLGHTGGNLSQAARILGIHRATLRTRLGALGLTTEGFASVREKQPA